MFILCDTSSCPIPFLIGGAWASGGYPDRYTQALPAGRISDLGKRVNDLGVSSCRRSLGGSICVADAIVHKIIQLETSE